MRISLGFRVLTGMAMALLASHGVAQEPALGTLIVLNKGEASASIIDPATHNEIARVPTGQGPHEVAVSPDGKTAVACNYGVRDHPGRSLTVIDLPTQRVVRTIDLGEYSRPHGIVFMPDGQRVVVTAEGAESLIVVDVESGEVVKAIDTDSSVSHMVAITPDAARAFVANIGSGTVTAIDLEKGTRLRNIATERGAEGIDVSPDGSEVWVTNRSAYTISIIDAESLEVVGEIACGQFPIRAAFTPDGKHVLVTCARSGDVAVFDAESREEVRRVPMKLDPKDAKGRLFGDRFGQSPVPIGVLVPPDAGRAYIANAQADLVAVVDLQQWKVVDALEAGREPDGMAWSPLDLNAEPEAPRVETPADPSR